MSKLSGAILLLATVFGAAFAAYPVWEDWSRTRSMTVHVSSLAPLVSDTALLGRDIRVLADGRELEEPHYISLEIRNDGSVPISAADFDGPVLVKLGNARVVKVLQNETRDPKVRAVIEKRENEIVIGPALFNPGDRIDISVVTAEYKPVVTVDARIADIRSVSLTQREVVQTKKPKYLSAAMYGLASFILAGWGGVLLRRMFTHRPSPTISARTANVLSWSSFMGALTTWFVSLSEGGVKVDSWVGMIPLLVMVVGVAVTHVLIAKRARSAA